jgi:riboflavin kinase/FMN adenylyltransferase
MDIYYSLEEIDNSNNKNIVLALGNFDGVHMGHRELIRKTIINAENTNGVPAVFTFDPHPMKVLHSEMCPPMLSNKEEKIRILSGLGISILFILPFSLEISNLSPESFVKDILVNKLKVKSVVVGYNYNFGCQGSGNVDMLVRLAEKYDFNVIVIPPVKLDEIEVSSTLIRGMLAEGNVNEAARFLGYYPCIISKVVMGKQLGRQIGYPTANIDLPEDILAPASGVYAVKIQLGEEYLDGVANIGNKPTVNKLGRKNLEVHMFDFSWEIYNKTIRVDFISRIRGEKKFLSIQQLSDQIKKDVLIAEKILSKKNAE